MISVFIAICRLSNYVKNLRLVSIEIGKDLDINTHTLFRILTTACFAFKSSGNGMYADA